MTARVLQRRRTTPLLPTTRHSPVERGRYMDDGGRSGWRRWHKCTTSVTTIQQETTLPRAQPVGVGKKGRQKWTK